MRESLIKRYNATVTPNSVCYFLGDMGNSQQEIKNTMDRLNGIKVLILGNHDKKHNAMYNCGFDVVLNSATLYIHQQRVTLSHCPLPGKYREDILPEYRGNSHVYWHGSEKPSFKQYQVEDTGQFHLHGHIHSRSGVVKSKKIEGRQYDVGLPANNYEVVSVSVIESWIYNIINKGKKS